VERSRRRTPRTVQTPRIRRHHPPLSGAPPVRLHLRGKRTKRESHWDLQSV